MRKGYDQVIGSFSFNGVESSHFGLVCKSVKRPLLPAKKINRVDLIGASGAYDFDDNEYSLRPITMRIMYIGSSYEELRSRARQIAAWLSTRTWARLIINDEPDKYYLAKITSLIDLDSLWESGKADIVFDCQPFAYSLIENSYVFHVTGTQMLEFSHPGTREINFKSPIGSKSLITITGTWSSYLQFMAFRENGENLMFNDPGTQQILIIDNVGMTAKLNGQNVFDKLMGDVDKFVGIHPGENRLLLSSSSIDADVKIDFIPLWI